MQAPAERAWGGAPKVALPHILLHALDEAVELLINLRTPQPHIPLSASLTSHADSKDTERARWQKHVCSGMCPRRVQRRRGFHTKLHNVGPLPTGSLNCTQVKLCRPDCSVLLCDVWG